MRICILIGGEGTNACAIIKAIRCGELKATCTGVISHSQDANGIARAQALGVPTQVVAQKDFEDKAGFEQALIQAIEAQSPDVIALAGFMRILSADFITHFKQQMILNIHPSLLPKYPGLNTHQRAIDAKDKFHGATVHIVTPECDSGPILMQADIPVREGDTAQTLKDRLLPLEHQLYIDALNAIFLNSNFDTQPLNVKEA